MSARTRRIAECAALGHPAPGGEDDLRLVAVLKPGGRLRPRAESFTWLEKRIPRFMHPRYIEFVDALPLSPTGKVEKYKLAAQGLSASAWDRTPGSMPDGFILPRFELAREK